MDLTVPRASRTFIVGQTGSGKSTLAQELVARAPKPLVILDTKWDPGIKSWARHHGVKIKYKMPEWKTIEEDMIVRPPADWLAQPGDLDWWLGAAFDCRYTPTVFIDEGYQVGATTHSIGSGLTSLWTRGRAFGFRTVVGAQRPAWISRFILSESDTYYIGHLADARDRKALAEAIGEPTVREAIPHRWFYRIRHGEPVQLLKPLDIEKLKAYRRNNARLTREKRESMKELRS